MKMEVAVVKSMVSILLFSSIACGQSEHGDSLGEFVNDALNQIGNVEIRGTVVSRTGVPVDGVKIDYYSRKYGDVFSDNKKNYKTLFIDGKFCVRENDITSIVLWFIAEGYYQQKWSYDVSQHSAKNGVEKRAVLDVEIVLIDEPTPAPLKKCSGVLRSDRNGPVQVLKTEMRFRSSASSTEHNGAGRGSGLQQIYLDPEIGYGGDIVITNGSSNDEHPMEGRLQRGWIRLNPMGIDDGFVVYEPMVNPSRPELGFREMLKAPVEGYTAELEISAEKGSGIVYFFCRLGGRYGKGLLNAWPLVDTREDPMVASSRIVVFLNPTGSRDVAYIHY